jgi:glycosyltransferase involved in cell wall biosynthesis
MRLGKATELVGSKGRSAVLYISYDGILEPLGQSQVLAYLRHIGPKRPIYLISFEKSLKFPNNLSVLKYKQDLLLSGIVWCPLRYHKNPVLVAKSWDICLGVLHGLWIAFRYQVGTVHARSYVASLIALIITRITRRKYLFDMRGFWAEEKLEDGWRNQDFSYKVTKFFERIFFLKADHIISLTHAAVPLIHTMPYLRDRLLRITVIPTCADLSRFKILSGSGRPSTLTIGYVGTATNWYLFDETVKCFVELTRIRSDVRFLILNRDEHEFIRHKIQTAGISLRAVELKSVSYEEIPSFMARMHASIYFIKPVFSKKASSATKLGELLGCGIPCMTNTGIGDVEQIFEGKRVGVLLESFEISSVVKGLRSLLALVEDSDTPARCRAVAESWFRLEDGVSKYESVYSQLDAS